MSCFEFFKHLGKSIKQKSHSEKASKENRWRKKCFATDSGKEKRNAGIQKKEIADDFKLGIGSVKL